MSLSGAVLVPDFDWGCALWAFCKDQARDEETSIANKEKVLHRVFHTGFGEVEPSHPFKDPSHVLSLDICCVWSGQLGANICRGRTGRELATDVSKPSVAQFYDYPTLCCF